jgi:hypothetical protein
MDTRNPGLLSFIRPKSVDELSLELSRLAQKFAQGMEWARYVPPPGVFRSTVEELPAFKETVKADIQQYLASLDIPDEEADRIYQKSMQHDLFKYQYIRAAHSFVAEPFPRQNIPLVFYRDYNDEPRYPGRFDGSSVDAYNACVATYKKLYAQCMVRLKEFADAIQSASALQQYIRDSKKIIALIPAYELGKHSSDLPDWVTDLVKLDPELLLGRLLDEQFKSSKDMQITELNEELFFAHQLTIMRFNDDCEAEFAKNTQYDPSSNVHIKALLDNQAPLNGLRFYSDINCFSFTPPWRRPAMHFHSAADLIQALTCEARLRPPVVAAAASVVSATQGAMFVKAGDGTKPETISKHEAKNLLRK